MPNRTRRSSRSDSGGVRRSKRQRKERYVNVDGFNILKLNNYSLEEGESSVYHHETRQILCRGKAKNAYQLFTKAYWEENEAPTNHSTRVQMLSSAWQGLGHEQKQYYREEAARQREELEREMEKAMEQEEIRAAEAAEAEHKMIEEREAQAEIEAEEWRESKRRQKAKPRKKRLLSKGEKSRKTKNEKMRGDWQRMKEQKMRFMARHRKVISPFVPEKILKKLPKLTDQEIDEMGEPDLDTEALVEQPTSIVGGKLRGYQLKGLEWMLYMQKMNTSMILGDEMGLGKTLQSISFLAALKERGICGPHLVVVPLSVLSAWLAEFRRWCPTMRVIRLHTSDKAERERLRSRLVNEMDSYDVVLTTYELCKVVEMRQTLAGRVAWRVVVLDEGHRVKNHESGLALSMRRIKSEIILLLTGTPLQNNLVELWALLNYLHPETFVDLSPFENAFELNAAEMSIDRKMLEKAHYMLRPFILRRLKGEVEKMLPPRVETKIMCPLSKMQQFWYKRLLLKNKRILLRTGGNLSGKSEEQEAKGDWKKLCNLMMQLRKCCNHPFLFPGAEDSIRGGSTWGSGCDDSIVTSSGKMENLDRLLKHLKEKGHRVVIFSQFTSMLDICDDYLNMRGYEFARLDGSTNRVQRMVDIQEFNKPNSPYFAFIMSTKAGGLGVNLQTADTVILLDSDWNPQTDMQAMARCHRIGQKKIVHVYRFITQGTMEERIVQRAQKKLFLDSMVNRGSTAQAQKMDKMGTKEVLEALAFGMDQVFDNSGKGGHFLTDEEIAEIIERVDPRTDEQSLKRSGSLKRGQRKNAADFEEKAPLLALQKFQGVDYSQYENQSMKDIAQAWAKEISGKAVRSRKSRFINVDGHTVLKQNMYSLEEGEPSILEKSKKNGKATIVSGGGRQIAGRDYDHMSVCLNCWDGGQLLCCDLCPSAYHVECLGMKDSDLDKIRFNWSCPAHRCFECNRGPSAVGGMLFRCEMCPMAYCEDHIPDIARKQITNRCKRFLNLGQNHPKQSCFVVCSKDCMDLYKRTDEGQDVDKICAIYHGGLKLKGNEKKSQKLSSKTMKSVKEMMEIEDDESNEIKVKPEEMDDDDKPTTELPKVELLISSSRKGRRPTPFDRLALGTFTLNSALQERMGILIEVASKPLPLDSFEGFRGRLAKVHDATLSLFHSALFESAYSREKAKSDLCRWAGVQTHYPDLKIPGTEASARENVEWRDRCAELYLHLVRAFQTKGSSGFSSHILKDIANLLDLKIEAGSGTKAVSRGVSIRMIPELIAVTLVFPCPEYSQVYTKKFATELDELGPDEPELINGKLENHEDLKAAINDELQDDPPWSRKTLSEHLGIDHREFLRWWKTEDFDLRVPGFLAGEMAVRWMLHQRAQNWSYVRFYHRQKLLPKPFEVEWKGTDFDIDRAMARVSQDILAKASLASDPRGKEMINLVDFVKLWGKDEDCKALEKKLEEFGWKFERFTGSNKVHTYLAPNRKSYSDLNGVVGWFKSQSLPEDEAQKMQKEAHQEELLRLIGQHNAQLATLRTEIKNLKNQSKMKMDAWKSNVLKRGWKELPCVLVEGRPQVIHENSESIKDAKKYLVAPKMTFKFDLDSEGIRNALIACKDIQMAAKIYKTSNISYNDRLQKRKEQEQRAKAHEEQAVLNAKKMERSLLDQLWSLKERKVIFGWNYYQRGRWAGLTILNFRGGLLKGKTDDYQSVITTYDQFKNEQITQITAWISRISQKVLKLENDLKISSMPLKDEINALKPVPIKLIYGQKSFIAKPSVEFKIGRKEENHLVISKDNVSRFHCKIKDGWVVDLKSRNGIKINGKKKTLHFLQPGDKITVHNDDILVERAHPKITPEDKEHAKRAQEEVEARLKLQREDLKKYEDRLSECNKNWAISICPDEREIFKELGLPRGIKWRLYQGRVAADGNPNDMQVEEEKEKKSSIAKSSVPKSSPGGMKRTKATNAFVVKASTDDKENNRAALQRLEAVV